MTASYSQKSTPFVSALQIAVPAKPHQFFSLLTEISVFFQYDINGPARAGRPREFAPTGGINVNEK